VDRRPTWDGECSHGFISGQLFEPPCSPEPWLVQVFSQAFEVVEVSIYCLAVEVSVLKPEAEGDIVKSPGGLGKAKVGGQKRAHNRVNCQNKICD